VEERAVFLGFGFVSAQSQGFSNLLLRRSLAKTQKILAPNGYSIFSNALEIENSSLLLFGFQKPLQLASDRRIRVDRCIAKKRGEHADEVGERFHFGPIQAAAFGEPLEAFGKFLRVLL
jgi:hypothetical protein